MLVLKGVNTYYGKSHILHDVSLRVDQGEILALIGRNGVGKSTTLKTIMGLVSPSSGSITFKGKEISGLKPFQIAREGIGYVPEERCIFPNLTVEQNLLIGVQRGKGDGAYGWTLDKCYEYFPELKRRRYAKGKTLSGGEQQMLAIARALMGNPELLLVDEPTEGLAPKIVEVVEQIIREINREGVTVLVVEQKLSMVFNLAQRVYVMSKGIIQWEGTPEELQGNEEVRKKFLEV
ncbi:MAG: ABC transporter ATP-binding protein [Deltaproteobacteria bacterium]|nr:MAG: ABC transporter ATP-binding protein [Deltaproteobacteria bacterium]